MSRKLEGKIALVTGGSRGIGAAIAKRLAADGASVAITYAKEADAAAAVTKAIEQSGGKALAIQADAANADAVKAAVAKTVATLGSIDVLVNNAGTAIPKLFAETTLEEIDRMMNINVRGMLVATQAALKDMKNGGRIINIGSCVGERNMTPGLVAYGATKGAVKMFTQSLSREVGSRGITVNNVQPGPIDTDLNPAAGDWAAPQKANTVLGRYGTVDEVAALVAFVASPEAAYITGANLTVDGGQTPNMSAYLIFTREKTLDPQELAAYSKEVRPTLAGHNAKILALYGKHEDLEGAATEGTVILEFPSAAEAKAWYDSPAYRKVREHRFKGAIYHVILIEGV